ncbi:hypothetical protein MTO96_023030 [Rhipicephalus appendiculatus]
MGLEGFTREGEAEGGFGFAGVRKEEKKEEEEEVLFPDSRRAPFSVLPRRPVQPGSRINRAPDPSSGGEAGVPKSAECASSGSSSFPFTASPPLAECHRLAHGPGQLAAREERVDLAPMPVAASARVL